jgi:hypothetical protein
MTTEIFCLHHQMSWQNRKVQLVRRLAVLSLACLLRFEVVVVLNQPWLLHHSVAVIQELVELAG